MLDAQTLRELNEAISAGEQAKHTAEEILDSLSRASGWGVMDLLGGGLVSTFLKHNRLDEAQRLMPLFQEQLRRFRTELGDVPVSADFQVNIDGFARFADYFFDGFLADLFVMSKVKNAQKQVEGIKMQIETILDRLYMLRTARPVGGQ